MLWGKEKAKVERIHPSTHQIVKLFPTEPPEQGDFVLVDGVPHEVVRAKVTWEGLVWTIEHVDVKKREAPTTSLYRA